MQRRSFRSEIEAVAHKSKTSVLQWDSAFQGYGQYRRGDWKKFNICGRGGTCMESPVKWLEDEGLVGDAAVMLTDGIVAKWPDERPYPMIFCIANDRGDTQAAPPKWGHIVRIEVQIKLINWERTKEVLKREDLHGRYPKVIMNCDSCGVEAIIAIRNKKLGKDNWICYKCANNKPQHRERLSDSTRKLWQNKEYREKVTVATLAVIQSPAHIQKASIISFELWKNPEYRQKMMEIFLSEEFRNKISVINKSVWNRPGYKENQTEIFKKVWQNIEYRTREIARMNLPEVRQRNSESHRRLWADPRYRDMMSKIFTSTIYRNARSKLSTKLWENDEYRAKITSIMKAKWLNLDFKIKMALSVKSVSKLQETFYSILTDLNIKFFREYNDKPNRLLNIFKLKI